MDSPRWGPGPVEIFNLHLTSMAHGGEALGRDESGRVIFVPYGIAGEEVRVEVVQKKKGFARAKLLEVISPSPARVTPRCPHFGPRSILNAHSKSFDAHSHPLPARAEGGPGEVRVRGCGGCQWQHIDYAAQLEFKRQIVREQFARIGKLPEAFISEVRAGKAWNYRNHMRFALDGDGRLSLQALESHDLVPLRECHILDAALVSIFNALELEGADFDAVTLRAGENTGDRLIVFEAADATPPEIETDEPVSIAFQVGATVVTLIGKEAIEERVRGRQFRISPRSFFQVNMPMAEVLLDLVEEFLAPRPDDILLDAYGGVGLFGLSLADRVAGVIEIEQGVDALEDARHNARELHADRTEFHSGRVEDILPKLESPISLAVVDPPRTGMAKQAVDALVSQAPRLIAYVSCDPATLARDARRLVDGGYRVTNIQPVDLFPQTYHIECVARFEK
jgi:23S rRNA (uracil1939-C5)-methyltransferase